MTITEFLKQKGISRYQISAASGLPWNTVAGICTGKIVYKQCDQDTLEKMANALGITTEELLILEQQSDVDEDGKPKDKNYLEIDLPESLKHAIQEYTKGEEEKVSHLDCLWGELYGSINACQWGGRITKEQADYLRKKYL